MTTRDEGYGHLREHKGNDESEGFWRQPKTASSIEPTEVCWDDGRFPVLGWWTIMTEDVPSSVTDPIPTNRMVGRADVKRVGRWRFPVHELRQDQEVLARLGRGGWFTTYLGRGQRVELSNGDRWTIGAIGSGGNSLPIILDANRRRVTMAGMSHGTYGINGKDYACVLYPKERTRFGRENEWILRQSEDEVAIIRRSPLSVMATHPVHLGAVLMSFVLIRLGLPEESAPRIPAFHWSR